MKINLAKSAGFCFGVERAIKIAVKLAGSDAIIEMLGDIVHNEDVSREIKAAGIKTVKRLTKGRHKILLVRAHGMPLKKIKQAQKLGYKIIDATCPMVKEIHTIAISMENKCRNIIIIGDKKHAEVQGIIGHLAKKPLLIDSIGSIPYEKIKRIKKACVVVQSTQNVQKANEIFKALKTYIKDLKVFNTICATTRKKQREIQTLPGKNDLIIIIGSKASANTKRLYEISRSINKKSYWVQSENDLKKMWFDKANSVGITAGASTPDYTIKNVIKQIKKITP